MSLDTLNKALGLGKIHEAVVQSDIKRVKELLRQGENPDGRTTTHGMTAMHLAFILRKYAIACLLICNKANLKARDRKGRTPARYNAKGLGGKYLAWFKKLGYRHDNTVTQDSSKLNRLFRYPAAMRSLERKSHPLSRTVMYLNGKKLVILKKVLTIPLPKPADDSTYGFVAGNKDPLPRAIAISGWEHRDTVLSSGVLPNAKFTRLVCHAARCLEFPLPEQGFLDTGRGRDVAPEDSGRYLASHVEKQLGLYWVLRLLKNYCGTSRVNRLGELKDVQLEENEKNARVFLNHNPCANCLGFLTRLEETTGVAFTVEPVPSVVKKERERKRGCENCSCDKCARQHHVPPATVPARDDPSDENHNQDEVTRDEIEPFRRALPQTPTRALTSLVPRGQNYVTSPPSPWVPFGVYDGVKVAKPRATEVSKAEFDKATSSVHEEGVQPASQTTSVIPVSTIAGPAGNRSAFFESPPAVQVVPTRTISSPEVQDSHEVETIWSDDESTALADLEVQIYDPTRGWHPPTSINNQPQDPVEPPSLDHGRNTIETSKKRLNLNRFRHKSLPSITSSVVQKRGRGRPRGPGTKSPPGQQYINRLLFEGGAPLPAQSASTRSSNTGLSASNILIASETVPRTGTKLRMTY